MSHTPGPWRVRTIAGTDTVPSIAYIKADTDHIEIAVVYAREHQSEDAHLIAAAPELLTSVRNLVSLAEHRGRLDEYVSALDVARAAIAKAEGKQP